MDSSSPHYRVVFNPDQTLLTRIEKMADQDSSRRKVLPQRAYGDPLAVLIKKEEQSCKGCVFAYSAYDLRLCRKQMPYGTRCDLYVEKEGCDGR